MDLEKYFTRVPRKVQRKLLKSRRPQPVILIFSQLLSLENILIKSTLTSNRLRYYDIIILYIYIELLYV